MSEDSFLVIALAGNPNCGKTALFNSLTGSHQKVANYPGITVERKSGRLTTPRGHEVQVVDLPGMISLDARSPDEEVSKEALFGTMNGEPQPDLVVAVADATNLERGLALVLELKSLKTPIVLALNMMDLAEKRGLLLNLDVLSQELGVEVLPTVATRQGGNAGLIAAIDHFVELPPDRRGSKSPVEWKVWTADQVQDRFRRVDEILRLATTKPLTPATWTERLDRVLLHPVAGLAILASTMLMIFQAVFQWAAPLQDGIESGIARLSQFFLTVLPAGALRDLLLEGVLAGVGGVLVFLPQILILFAFVLLLEDVGYMARAVFLLDRLMGSVGLHGRSFVPLLSSFACAIPGVMATRTIENKRDRILTILVAPLMTCSARIPVYVMLIAAFIPSERVVGPFSVQGLVLFGLYLMGIVFAFFFATLFKRTVLRGPNPALILEMPTYKWPHLKNLRQGLVQRTVIFLKRAGTLILSLSLLLWFLSSYPKVESNQVSEPPIYYSYAGQLGRFLAPALAPLGFDWRISVALVPGFAAREVMVSGLATVFSVEASDEAAQSTSLGSKLASSWSLATALSLLLWYVFAPQCLSTFAVIRRETGSWKWTAFSFGYLLVTAYLVSFLGYRLFVSLGWGA